MTVKPLTTTIIVGMSGVGAATLMSLIGWLLFTTQKLDVSVGRLTVQVEALETRDARLTALEALVNTIERRAR